jgi:hypothetical protein
VEQVFVDPARELLFLFFGGQLVEAEDLVDYVNEDIGGS